MPPTRGNGVLTHCFEDSDLAGNKVNRRSQTGILIFVDRAPIIWHSETQNTVEASRYGSDIEATKNTVELIEVLRYKLHMFGVPIDGPTNIFVIMRPWLRIVWTQPRCLRRSIIQLRIIGTVRLFLRGLVTLLNRIQTRTWVIYSQSYWARLEEKICWTSSLLKLIVHQCVPGASDHRQNGGFIPKWGSVSSLVMLQVPVETASRFLWYAIEWCFLLSI